MKDTNGVYFVPAFVGLAAPYWDPYARGTILGLTLGANRNHIIRAALEAICYQIGDVIDADGGRLRHPGPGDQGRRRRARSNNFLMQLQSDLLDVPVLRPTVVETTARGAAFLAGLAIGFWADRAELAASYRVERTFTPDMPAQRRQAMYAGWQKAVGRARTGKTTRPRWKEPHEHRNPLRAGHRDGVRPGHRPGPGRAPLRRSLSAMAGMYADADAVAAQLAADDLLVYEFYDMGVPATSGDVAYGTSVVRPGRSATSTS